MVFSYVLPDAYELAVGVSSDSYQRQWGRCGDCGFYYARYNRDPEILDRIYEVKYRDSSANWRGLSAEETFTKYSVLTHAESETKQRVKWIKDTVNDGLESQILTWEEEPWRLLDIGGATGLFAHEFNGNGWEPHVVDPSKDGEFIRHSLGISYLKRSYQSGLFNKKFNLIALNYALEHLREPETILRLAHQDLIPGGCLYIEVPDALAFNFKSKGDDIFNSCHLWMFDPVSMVYLLKRSKFDVVRLQRIRTVRNHFALSVLAVAFA